MLVKENKNVLRVEKKEEISAYKNDFWILKPWLQEQYLFSEAILAFKIDFLNQSMMEIFH